MKLSSLQQSFLNAFGTILYVAGVAYFLFNGKAIFGEGDNFLAPLFMLLLLIISATITGYLVIGKPLQLLVSDEKAEALRLLWQTLGWIIGFTICIILILIK